MRGGRACHAGQGCGREAVSDRWWVQAGAGWQGYRSGVRRAGGSWVLKERA